MGEGRGGDISATLYVGHNLPESITKDHILQHFKTFVPDIDVLKSTVITNKAGKRHCKLVFTNDVAAEQAISQMNGTQIRGFKLHVNRWSLKKKESGTDSLIQFLEKAEPQHVNADDDDDSSDDSQSDISSVSIGSSLVCETEGSFRAYVGSNLPDRIQESTLQQHFQSSGYTVKSARIVTSKKNHTRFAILALSSQEALDAAIKQLHGGKLLGYKLNVSHWVDTGAARIKHKGSTRRQEERECPKEQGKGPSVAGSQSTDLCTVIIRGIPNTVDESLLRSMCEAYGELTHLEVNRNEGTAVISYPSPEVAATASTRLNRLKCGGGTLLVVSSASKEPLYPDYIAPAPSLSHEVSPLSVGPCQPGYSMPHQPLAGTFQGSLPPLQGHPPQPQGRKSPLHSYRPHLQSYVPPPQDFGTSTQGQDHSKLVSVKVSNIHPSITDEELKRILSVVPSAVVVFHATPGSKPNYAHVNCTDPADVNRVMEILKGRKFNGLPLSVKTQKGKDFSVPQGLGPPLQGHGPILQGQGPQMHGHRPPLHGHGPPLQSYAPPLQGHGPPLHGHGPPPHGHGPPPHGHGPLHQGYGSPPQAYGTFTQVQDHSGLVSIKISNIHHSITDEELKRILSVVPSAVVVFHATPGSKPNYAHVNCTDPADVNRVMEILKGRKFNGMPVSVKTQIGKDFSVPPPPVRAEPPVDMQAPVSVKVTRLPKSATEKQLHRLIRSIQGVSSVVLKTVLAQEHNYAYVNCENGFAAEQVAQSLNGMQLLGSTIKATLQQSKKTKENEEVDAPGEDTAEEGQEMSQDLYDFFQHRFRKEIATFEASGGILQYSEGFIIVRGPEAEVNAFYKNSIKPMKDGSQPLTADQWGQLMAAKKGGTTLFQELSSPFLHNPNLKLERRENPFTLVIVGFQEAVDAATSHFFSKMDAKMVVNR